MRLTTRHVEVANLVITSGDTLKLLDLFEDVVWPAFTDSEFVRSYGDNRYLFHGVELVDLGNEVGLVGRIVKDSVLTAKQRLIDSELIEVDDTLRSSPSSVFLLLLGCHRLLYVREHAGAPDLGAFRSTLSLFVRKRHATATREIQEAERLLGVWVTLKELFEQSPAPTVELRPLASPESLKSYLATFSKLETVSATLLKTNHEGDNNPFFAQLRENDRRIGSESTTLQYQNKEKGLNKAEAERQLTDLAQQGNHSMKLKGVDHEGGKLNGTEKDFRVRVPIDAVPKLGAALAKKLNVVFNRLVDSGSIKVGKLRKHAEEKLEEIKETFDL